MTSTAAAQRIAAAVSAAAANTGGGRFGKLWGRGHETFVPSDRRILSVSGPGATKYLQGLVTCDLLSEPPIPRREVDGEAGEGGADGNVSSPSGANLASLSSSSSSSSCPTLESATCAAPAPLPIPTPTVRFCSAMRSACFLDHRGRIVTDALLWKWRPSAASGSLDVPLSTTVIKEDDEAEYLIDVAGDAADRLLDHLRKHKLRKSRVKIGDKSDEVGVHAVYGTLNAEGTPLGFVAAMDPRHPSLGMRVLSIGNGNTATNGDANARPSLPERNSNFQSMMSRLFPPSNGTYQLLRRLAGVAEGSELTGKTALECNQDFLNAVSFSKGCYLGQELTARSQFTGHVRKRILPLVLIDDRTQVPRPWLMADLVQELGPDDLTKNLFGTPDEGTIDVGLDLGLDGGTPPPLPRISVPGMGGLLSMLMGTAPIVDKGIDANEKNEEDEGEEEKKKVMEETHDDAGADAAASRQEEELRKLQDGADALLEQVSAVAVQGAKIIDEKDGKTIGQILSPPAPGTIVILAQMRLDRVGLAVGGEPWSRKNRVRIGDDPNSPSMRYLPFLPLWWPDIDRKTGKRKG